MVVHRSQVFKFCMKFLCGTGRDGGFTWLNWKKGFTTFEYFEKPQCQFVASRRDKKNYSHFTCRGPFFFRFLFYRLVSALATSSVAGIYWRRWSLNTTLTFILVCFKTVNVATLYRLDFNMFSSILKSKQSSIALINENSLEKYRKAIIYSALIYSSLQRKINCWKLTIQITIICVSNRSVLYYKLSEQINVNVLTNSGFVMRIAFQ